MSAPDDTAATRQEFRLIYRSHSLIPAADRKVALGNLFTEARSNNKGRGITGALLLTDDHFVQTLEGDESAVRALYEHIATDPRHDEVTLIDAREMSQRVFSKWAMARVADDGGADIPLIAHEDGISPAAGQRATPAQQAVLELMRIAARDDSPVG